MSDADWEDPENLDAPESEELEQEAVRTPRRTLAVGTVMTYLLKGPVYRADSPVVFSNIKYFQGALFSRFDELGLRMELDEDDGMAWLRSKREDEYPDEDHESVARLLPKMQLPWLTSFVLTWLRLKVNDLDNLGEPRYLLTFDEIFMGLSPYFKERDEAALRRRLSGQMKRICELGMARLIKDAQGERYEILRIIKALVTAQVISRLKEELEQRLSSYQDYGERRNSEAAADGEDEE